MDRSVIQKFRAATIDHSVNYSFIMKILDFSIKKKEGQKYIGTYIYILKTKQINHQISIGKMDGSIRFSYPGKRGKPDFMSTPKLYSGSKIVLKSNYFI